jgi:hypothetical protein
MRLQEQWYLRRTEEFTRTVVLYLRRTTDEIARAMVLCRTDKITRAVILYLRRTTDEIARAVASSGYKFFFLKIIK